MGTISVSLPSDGTVADVSDYNTPLNTIVNEFNGNIDNANIKSGAAISTTKLASDAGITNGMITDGTISAAKLNFGGSGSGIWWEEIGRTTLSSAGDTITVSSLPARKYLWLKVSTINTGGDTNHNIQCNGDTGNSYSSRYSTNGAADTTLTSRSDAPILSSTTAPKYSDVWISNIATEEKIFTSVSVARNSAGAASAPDKWEGVGKWANTSNQISSITLKNSGAGDYAIGSEVIVLGHN